jgi:hypothetical protein
VTPDDEDIILPWNGPKLRYTNDRAREMEANVSAFARLVNNDLYDLLKWAEQLREAIRELYTAADKWDGTLSSSCDGPERDALRDAFTKARRLA